MRWLTLVAGPPCAGRADYVREHMTPGALVIDRRVLGHKTYHRRVSDLGRTTGEVWVIEGAAGPDARANLARRLGADEVVVVCPDEATLLSRATTGADRVGIRNWLVKEHGLSRVRSPHRSGHLAREVRAATFVTYGTVCVICGHDGATESGHVVSLAVAPDQPVSAEGRRPVHGGSAPCPVCHRACNQQQGTRSMDATFRPRSAW
jgi:hypothetical protein